MALERLKRDVVDWSTISATFDELPDTVHQAVADELLAGVPIWPEPASWEHQSNFRSLEEGKALWREWGDAAPQKLGVVRARLWQIHARLSDEDSEAIGEWFDGLEPAEARSVLALLAGTA